MDLGELLDQVRDFDTFLRFAHALIAERERAAEMEREQPDYYRLGGALGWQNTSIESFLECALAGFVAQPGGFEGQPTWADVARLLYLGKIYE